MLISVKTDTWDYDIVLEEGALGKTGELLELGRRALIVTDSGVPSEYSELVAAQCAAPTVVTVPQGEQSKCFGELERLLSEMLDASFTRGDCVVAVGGGVVGDLSGFVASCYMRGIDFYNIPTTLLSQVDSSIGGKTAIDLNGVKNIDPAVLKTLERRQLMAGLAEAIKMAATSDAELFEEIERSEDLNADLVRIIHRALLIKKSVVEQDVHETGLRKVLNFGHTIGHAVESFNGGRLLHGECVALGMLPMCSHEAAARIEAVLKKYGLPHEIEQSSVQLMPYLLHDKKMGTDGISCVLINEIGSFELRKMTAQDILKRLEGER